VEELEEDRGRSHEIPPTLHRENALECLMAVRRKGGKVQEGEVRMKLFNQRNEATNFFIQRR
jgi:hypothetical protein